VPLPWLLLHSTCVANAMAVTLPSPLVDCCLLIFYFSKLALSLLVQQEFGQFHHWLLCHDAVIISCLLALLLLVNCCFPKKCSGETITCWTVHAAATLLPLCYDGDTIAIVPLQFCLAYAGTVAACWLLFITLFNCSHTMTSSAARAAAMLPSL